MSELCPCCHGTRIGPANSNFVGMPCPVCAHRYELPSGALALIPRAGQTTVRLVDASDFDRLLGVVEEMRKDAERYRWLRDHKCNSLHLTRDGDHACNYVTAKEWIESYQPDWFDEDSLEEIQRMKDTNTIWALQIYPNTPIGFNKWNSATLDSVIDRAMAEDTP